MNIKNIGNVYRQYVNSGNVSGNYSQKVFSINSKKNNIDKKDSLSFSSEAALLRSSSKTVRKYASEIKSNAPDERIDSLRQKIKSGDYNIDSKKIADSILNRFA